MEISYAKINMKYLTDCEYYTTYFLILTKFGSKSNVRLILAHHALPVIFRRVIFNQEPALHRRNIIFYRKN